MTMKELRDSLLAEGILTHFRNSFRLNPNLEKTGTGFDVYLESHPEAKALLAPFSRDEGMYRIIHAQDETPVCPVCGKPRLFKNISKGYLGTCGDKSCVRALRDQTVLDKYGTTVPMQSEVVKSKFRKTCLDKYGVEYPAQNKEIRSKGSRTCLERYGVENYLQTEECQRHIEETSLRKYGTKHPNQSKECQEKTRATNQARYGVDCVFASPEIQARVKATCMEKYGVENAGATKDVQDKRKATMQERYGADYYSQTQGFQAKVQETCMERYGAPSFLASETGRSRIAEALMDKYGVDKSSDIPGIHDKVKKTCMTKYGVSCSLWSEEGRAKVLDTFQKNYGTDNPSKVPSIHKRQMGAKGSSVPERKIAECLANRGLEFQSEYFCNGKNFDFAVFRNGELKVLVEIDGEYFHALLSDPDGFHVHGFTDSARFQKVPEGVKLVVCDSERVDDCIAEIMAVLDISYDEWIAHVKESLPKEFPYPVYDESRMRKDYSKLQTLDAFKAKARIADSTIKNFHKSIYSAHVGNSPSPIEAWNDPVLLDKCVRNRFIYASSLSSQAIANGFNVCKLAPKVSVFSASLAKTLVQKYLSEYDTIFDPFSGFSGRMLGTCACGKKYIGQDINPTAVEESNQIIGFHNLDATVECRDVFRSNGTYPCLFTCSPYSLKETWNNPDQANLSCDNWIDVCLRNFQCRKYLFVVDGTEKYKDYIVETLRNTSHFGENQEYVVCIPGNFSEKPLY